MRTKIGEVTITIDFESGATSTALDFCPADNVRDMTTMVINEVAADGIGSTLPSLIRKRDPDLVKEVQAAMKDVKAHQQMIRRRLTPLLRKLDKVADEASR